MGHSFPHSLPDTVSSFSSSPPSHLLLHTMDAIKKKMQAMKVEKDNAMDRADVCEQASKDAKVRAGKAEEEVEELIKKSQQLEVELDKTMEKLKEKENSLSSAELEVAALNRRVQGIEGDLETCEDKLLLASQKLDKAATAADDSDRMRKVL